MEDSEKIKLVKCIVRMSHPDFGYFAGETAHIRKEIAEEMQRNGFVEIIEALKK